MKLPLTPHCDISQEQPYMVALHKVVFALLTEAENNNVYSLLSDPLISTLLYRVFDISPENIPENAYPASEIKELILLDDLKSISLLELAYLRDKSVGDIEFTSTSYFFKKRVHRQFDIWDDAYALGIAKNDTVLLDYLHHKNEYHFAMNSDSYLHHAIQNNCYNAIKWIHDKGIDLRIIVNDDPFEMIDSVSAKEKIRGMSIILNSELSLLLDMIKNRKDAERLMVLRGINAYQAIALTQNENTLSILMSN